MADDGFENPRLAALYDPLDPDRSDLAVYAGMAAEFGARSVLDIGCGTGTLCCVLACLGFDVVGLEPALASLEIARSKPYADRVRWVQGTVASLAPSLRVDLVTMTANVAQVFLTEPSWESVLAAANAALRPGGRLVFETRNPARAAWRSWDRAHTFVRADVAGVGGVTTWQDLLDVDGECVTFRSTTTFDSDGATLTSDSTLRFRTGDAVSESLSAAGFTVDEIRDAPDRPGRELVFVATRE
ncbi:MAG TPA: class I SAM-dependent methyltransferase [Trebonia sp.]|jgi:SAM-dependent methyltransferase|nr:class I SAM-dependent methyltransferase [Trebonia sp.]